MQMVQETFDDLGVALADVTFVVVDLETTGGSPAGSQITEFGAVKVRGGEVLGEFQTLVRPSTPIPPFITVLTGITNAMVADAPGIGSPEDAAAAYADELARFAGEPGDGDDAGRVGVPRRGVGDPPGDVGVRAGNVPRFGCPLGVLEGFGAGVVAAAG